MSGKPWSAFSSPADLWCKAATHAQLTETTGVGPAYRPAIAAWSGLAAAGRKDPPYDSPDSIPKHHEPLVAHTCLRNAAPRARLRQAVLDLFYLAGLAGTHSSRPAADLPRRILLLRPDHLGDVLLSFPAIAVLRSYFPQSEITLAVGPWSKDIAEHNQDIDSLVTVAFPGFDRAGQRSPFAPYHLLVQAASTLRLQGFDLAINLRNDFWWGAVLMYLARIPRRYGYATPESKRFLTTGLPPNALHMTDQSLVLVQQAVLDSKSDIAPWREPCYEHDRGLHGICRGEPVARPPEPVVSSMDPSFRPRPDEVERARQVLDDHGISSDSRLVVIHPGAGADIKLWTPEGFGSLVRHLVDSRGAKVAITGSTGEKPLAKEIAALSGRDVADLAGLLTVGELAAVLAAAGLAIGVDNGPMHLAAAVGTPTVRLFGPTDPSLYGPRGCAGRHAIVRAGLPCVPCRDLSRRNPEGRGGECMEAIQVDEVIAAVDRLLGEGGRP